MKLKFLSMKAAAISLACVLAVSSFAVYASQNVSSGSFASVGNVNQSQSTPVDPEQSTPVNPGQSTPVNPGQSTPVNPEQSTPLVRLVPPQT